MNAYDLAMQYTRLSRYNAWSTFLPFMLIYFRIFFLYIYLCCPFLVITVFRVLLHINFYFSLRLFTQYCVEQMVLIRVLSKRTDFEFIETRV